MWECSFAEDYLEPKCLPAFDCWPLGLGSPNCLVASLGTVGPAAPPWELSVASSALSFALQWLCAV